ncbi:MAG: acyl-CoA dehydrogenase family protein, partial [Aeromicrobium sp.]
MDFGHDAKTLDLVAKVEAFMDAEVYPAEATLKQQIEDSVAQDRWTFPPIVMELRAKAKAQGLWNFFDPSEHGAGLTNLQYAPIAEITGRSIQMAPAVFNCAAPDTGNMEVLSMFGTDEQKKRWLEPLLAGDIRSAFAMTEPQVASSDATNVEMSIVRDGGDYVINGSKWWITGAMNPDCKIFIVMGKTDPEADRHRQQSMILVERDTPGLEIIRGMRVFGYHDRDHGGHAEMRFTDVRVPAANLIAGEGEGFAIAQARLGPGRIHHCMRSLGIAERAVEMMSRRALERVAFGKPIADQGVVRDWIAESRVKIEQLRLLSLKAAWLMDTVGNKGAAMEISSIKVVVPNMALRVVDRAIQAHGGGGVSDDFPLARMWAGLRTLRF